MHGFIEVKAYADDPWWNGVVNVQMLAGRNYFLYGLLFDQGYLFGTEPIAGYRGLPADISEEAKENYEEKCDGPSGETWIGWEEIRTINWQAVQDAMIAEASLPLAEARVDILSLGDFTSPIKPWEEWRTLFSIMRLLAQCYPPELVRLVAWFTF
jgi:hypothetical protein